ncbi:uncharacterized protein [Nicotiana tomentosiformis]|uniref:uncharacterized protein n=1 Tax=Nicotiana tomentosiformis TaxID=4098 RepID=UPI00388CB31E
MGVRSHELNKNLFRPLEEDEELFGPEILYLSAISALMYLAKANKGGGSKRRFLSKWFDDYGDWLEYSVSTNAAYYLPYYLFKGDNIHQGRGDVFSSKGFRNWHKIKDSFSKHIGRPNSVHNQAKRNCVDLMQQQQSIHASFDKQSDQLNYEYRLRLNASIDAFFRGIEIDVKRLRFFYCKMLQNNNKMTSLDIQKEIVTACKIETIKAIIEDLNGDYFYLLVDKSFDVSRKEQMDIVLRYVDRKGFVMEVFIGLVHVPDTSALSLKKAIVNVLAHHSLSLSSVRV